MKEAIKIKPEWETILRKHENKCDDLQQVVNKLTESGLTVTFGDIKDLISHGTALYDQVEQTVKSNAGMFKLPAARQKFIDENTAVLRTAIVEAKKDIDRILAIPLTIEAFDIRKGTVSISDIWVEQLKESHTIHSTDEREKALELIGNVEEAIKNLNAFVANNKSFGAGITSSQDQRRCLMFIRGDGSVHIDIDALEFI
jgi:hypothetical protein